MYTIDTNILIYHINGDRKIARFFLTQFERDISLFLPTIAVVEFFAFPTVPPEVRAAFESLLPHFRLVSLDYPLSLAAGKLRSDYRLKLGDSVIAATALATGTSLVTRNVRDFKKIPELKIMKV